VNVAEPAAVAAGQPLSPAATHELAKAVLDEVAQAIVGKRLASSTCCSGFSLVVMS
jgi:hypothetical protein